MARRREFSVFSLSFLDIMSCGFGAVILIYIIIHHSTETSSQVLNTELLSEAQKLEIEVTRDTEDLAQLKNVLIESEEEIITAEALTLDIVELVNELKGRIANLDQSGMSQHDSIESLKTELKRLEDEAASFKGSVAASEASGTALRSVVGEGDRQYLTGLRIGGERILILIDASASMLDETIVNVVRLRNMSDERRLQAEKWQRALRTAEWIIANIPRKSSYQVVIFNTVAKRLVTKIDSSWIEATDRETGDKLQASLRSTIPKGGTSLHAAFTSARNMNPKPDNIFLIVDGLPTQGALPPNGTIVSSKDRSSHFWSSLAELPDHTSVNVILFPMEGDPMASPSYWQLAQMTGGSFLSPPKDWP